MKLIVNGDPVTLPEHCNVEMLLRTMELSGRLAVEVNGEIVPRCSFIKLVLNQDDRVEIVRAIGGG